MQQGTVEIIDVIRNEQNGISKKDIAPLVSLSWGGLCLVTKRAIEKKIIAVGKATSVRRGRPCVPLHLIPDAMFFCGVDIGSNSTKLVICDLNFTIYYQQQISTPVYTDRDAFEQWLTAFISDTLCASKIKKIHGIGIAVSGNVDSVEGIIVSGGNFGMPYGSNIAVADLSRLLQIPCYAINTQAASVCAEYHFGQFAHTANIVNIGLGVGIGSGIISDSKLMLCRPSNMVGYIGHMLMSGNQYHCKNTSCNFVGCLEAFSGGNNLAAIVQKELGLDKKVTTREIDLMASSGHPGAIKLLTKAAEYNAIGVATMIQMYSPDVVVFSGGQCKIDGFVYLQTQQQLLKMVPQERQKFQIGLSILGDYQAALGSARLAYEQFMIL